MKDDTFHLYDLKVELVRCRDGMKIMSANKIGDYFLVRGEMLEFPTGMQFSMYTLAGLIPLLPTKQRETHPYDWMSTDAELVGPDPHDGAVYKVTRISQRTFSHAETSAIPLE